MGDEFRLYFVQPDGQESSNVLVKAFETLNKKDFNFKPEWITHEQCLAKDGTGKEIFIFDPFEGKGFNHIKDLGYRIYGPRCILDNLLLGLHFPENKKNPIYNLAMKGLVVCCTSLDKNTRNEISMLVQLMGGKVLGDFLENVTHLIAGEVGSSKYQVAMKVNKQVMVKEWVYKVWESSKERQIIATDDMFSKYKCPPFLGLTIVVSGFSNRERNNMMSFITRGGGKYSGELKMNECTHLIVKEPKGAKYEAALKWEIKVVNDQWLQDCMDKQRYLDPKPYQYNVKSQAKSVKTSTPERRSTNEPNISDISVISNAGLSVSMQRVSESVDMTSTRMSGMFAMGGKNCDISETRLGMTTLEADTTITPADVFLDGCRIYLSGVKSSLEEKLRKIISAGGGLRAMDIGDGITHVVVGDIVTSDINLLNKLQECPHVVSTDWLMDCFHVNNHLNEAKYLRNDLSLKTNSLEEKHEKPKQTTKVTPTPTVEQKHGKKSNGTQQDNTAFRMEAASDLEMAELLSQYIDPAVNPNNTSKDTDSEVQVVDLEANNNVTITEPEEATQNPNEITDSVVPDKGIFDKISFIIIGFEESETAELLELIEQKGGKCIINGKKRQVADIGIVPLMGYPVDVTVSEVLTIAWLQMCIESDKLLPFDSNLLFRPMDLPENEPLKGSCLCISGYSGIERQCLLHLAEGLGAICKEHFSRKSRKNLEASTHLIVNQPSGSKYDAAKKWNIPAVGKEWIFACLQEGGMVAVEEYTIKDVIDEVTDKIPKLSEENNKIPKPSAENNKIPTENTDSNAQNKNEVNPVVQAAITTPTTTSKSVVPTAMKSACRPNQSDNISAGCMKTPVDLLRQKWGQTTPGSRSSPLGLRNTGGETPGTFMKPDFVPKFNFDGHFTTPDTATDLNKSTPLGEVFRRNIAIAAQNAWAEDGLAGETDDGQMPASQSAPLIGVVIAVAKKLGRNHETYNNIVVELGGNYSWHIGPQVTHFVFQGRLNDTNKEFRNAVEERKTIVSPFWLFACKEQNCRVDERLFPYNYNPNLSLAMTPASKITPVRSTRATARTINLCDGIIKPIESISAGKTPNRKMPSSNLQKDDLQNEDLQKVDTKRNPDKAIISRPTNNVSSELSEIQVVKITLRAAFVGEIFFFQSFVPLKRMCHTKVTSKNKEIKDALTKTMGNALANVSRYYFLKYILIWTNFGQPSDGYSSGSPLSRTSPSGTTTSSMIKPSQSSQVTWDDPTERLEKEKLACRLERVCEPSQNTDELLAGIDINGSRDITSKRASMKTNNAASELANKRSPTPEPPPIAFPLAKPTSHILPPQPVDLLSDESNDNTTNMNRQPPALLITGVQNQQERVEYSALVEELGGKMLDKQHFDPAATHLILGQPARNEKCLSCIAAGKWVLHKSYLEACRKEGKFAQEEPHEWGSEYTLPLMQNMTEQANKLVAAAYKWRRKIEALKKTNPSCKGAYDGWKVLLCLDKSKEENFKRILEAGGASVATIRSPLPEDIEGTHAFIDLNKIKLPQEDLERLIQSDIHCLKPEYIPAYLTDEPPPDPSEFYPAEVTALKASMPELNQNRKRRRTKDDHGRLSKILKH
ncbi:unnamed protein product [Lymnaea stagnalis]|uniref:BRCT domain-containing protein n=1 Tax=Lymnaea stagnalis TaxID=6523 RepID=A0AAV2I1R2_LYMST